MFFFFTLITLSACSKSDDSPAVGYISGVMAISAGEGYSVVLKNDGTVWAWGDNSFDQLGVDSAITAAIYTPVQVSGLSGITAISTAYSHILALKTDGTVWAWGDNSHGQLGIDKNITTQSYIPVQILGLTNITAISAGWNYTIALKNDGTVWALGDNSHCQLGVDKAITTDRYTPMQVSGLSNITAISAGGAFTIALKDDETVWAWGDNYFGQLGVDNALTTDRYTPMQISGLSNITAIDAGYIHSLALENGGTVWAWGDNVHGQLGDGTTTQSYTPVHVSGLTNITEISAGYIHSLALENSGTVLAWGDNSKGQLGDGTITQHYTPVPVSGLTNITAIDAGWLHTLALKNDGTVWAWGFNNYGELGDGTVIQSYTPVQVQQ